ncbi:MAG: hypothetical protein ABUM51_01965, partial [Bacteroidota bacterium]
MESGIKQLKGHPVLTAQPVALITRPAILIARAAVFNVRSSVRSLRLAALIAAFILISRTAGAQDYSWE